MRFVRVCRRNSVSEIAQMLNMHPFVSRIQPVELRFRGKLVSETDLSSCEAFFGKDCSIVSIEIFRKRELKSSSLTNTASIETPSFRKVQDSVVYDSKISSEFWKRRNKGFIVTEKNTCRDRPTRGKLASSMLIPDNSCPSWGLEQSQDEEWYEVERIVGFRASGIEDAKGRGRRERTHRNDYSHFLVKWQGYDDLTWEPTENLHPKAIRNFLLQISRDISESRRKLVGQSVILSRVDNNGMASTKNNKKSIFATCIGVCRCGQFEKNDFHAIVRESPSLPSFTARRVQSRRKKRRRKLINNNSVHHTQTRCIRFDSILRHRPHPFQENEKSTMNAENHEKKEKISICTTT
jgi:hypothetical protein